MAGTFSCNSMGAGWETFAGVDAYGREVSPLTPVERRLEENPPCSIDDLLDEEGLVLEFRAGNARLTERLCSPGALRALVEYVVREPPAEAPEASRCRRPYVAAELLSCNADRVAEVFAGPESSGELLDLLWSFMDSPAEGLEAPALAGYFCSTAAALLARRPVEVAEYLRRRGSPSELFERFLAHLEIRCLAELLALLLGAEAPSHAVFPTEGLVRRLVGCLAAEGLPCAAHEHAAFLLDHLLAKACVGDLCYGGELLRQFAEPAVVAALVDGVLSGGPGAGPAAAVLSSAVSHLHLLPCHPLLPTKSPELRAPSGPQAPGQRLSPPARPPAPLGDREPQEVGDGGEPPPEPGEPPMDAPPPPPGMAANAAESAASSEAAIGGLARLGLAGAALVEGLCVQLPRLCGLLEAAAGQRAAGLGGDGAEAAAAVGPPGFSQDLHEAIVLLLEAEGHCGGSTLDGEVGSATEGGSADMGPLAARLGELSERPGVARELREVLERHGWLHPGPGRPAEESGSLREVLAELRRAAQFRRADAAAEAAGRVSTGMVVEILSLLALLVKTGRAAVFEALLAANALPCCLELLLASASSSVLHNAVRALVSEVLSSCAMGPRLALSLLGAGPLMQRVVAEHRRDAEAREEGAARDRYRRSQVGFIGPLRGICTDLVRLATCAPEVAAALADIEGWAEAVVPEIEAAEQLAAEPLGGPPPEPAPNPTLPNFDCLLAMHGAMTDQGGDEIDLTLEDLRDINEDLDVQQMLNRAEQQMLDRADLQMRRRAKAGAEVSNLPDAGEVADGQPTPGGQACGQKMDLEWV